MFKNIAIAFIVSINGELSSVSNSPCQYHDFDRSKASLFESAKKRIESIVSGVSSSSGPQIRLPLYSRSVVASCESVANQDQLDSLERTVHKLSLVQPVKKTETKKKSSNEEEKSLSQNPQTKTNDLLQSPQQNTQPCTVVASTVPESLVEITFKDLNIYKFYPSYKLPGFTNLRVYKSHLSSINYRTRIPDWVAEKITHSGISGSADRSSSVFYQNQSVPELWRSRNEDYRLSGYDRGHMAPAGSHHDDQECMNSTFCLSSNILPQSRTSNVGGWYQLEKISRLLATYYQNVYVISGPLWMTKSQFQNKIIPIDQQDDGTHSVEPSVNSKATTTETDEKKKQKTPDINNQNKHSKLLIYINEKRQQAVQLFKNLKKRMVDLVQKKKPKKKKTNEKIEYEVIGSRCIAVPTHLFKIILATHPLEKQFQINRSKQDGVVQCQESVIKTFPYVMFGAFIVPNDNSKAISILDLQRSIRLVEFYSGLDFSGLIEYASGVCVDEIRRLSRQGDLPKDVSTLLGDGSQMSEFIQKMKMNEVVPWKRFSE